MKRRLTDEERRVERRVRSWIKEKGGETWCPYGQFAYEYTSYKEGFKVDTEMLQLAGVLELNKEENLTYKRCIELGVLREDGTQGS